MVTKLQNAWTDLSSTVSIGAIEMVVGVMNTLAGIPTQLAKGFATAVTWLQGAFDETVNFIAKKLLYIYSLIDRSVDYEKAAMQMDKDAAKRADARQKSLDTANQKRDQELQTGNTGRLQLANQMTQGITAQANQTKSDREGRNAQSLGVFDKSISDLRASLKTQTAEIDKNAPGKGFLSFLGPLGQAVEAVVDTAKTLSAPTSRKIPTVEQVKATTATQVGGTFSGFAAGMLGGTTSALDRMADQSAKSNDLLSQIAKNTAQSPSPTYGT
jgi:hypothetical protein